MNIKQGLESSLIGVGDNYIVMENVVDNIDVTYTVRGVNTEVYNFNFTANDGEVDLNLREITRLVYDNVEFYQDPFDYENDVLYTETAGYHYIKLDISITDANSDNVTINDISVINAALDVGECLLLTALVDNTLNQETAKQPTNFIALNYDLNFALH